MIPMLVCYFLINMVNYIYIWLILSLVFPSSIVAKEFGGEKIFFMKNQSPAQMLSIVLLTKNKKIIIFDGGTKTDSKHLTSFINKHGGKVSAWFLTHLHDDHTGALSEIVLDDNITIDNIYYHFPPSEWVEEHEPMYSSHLKMIVEPLEKMAYLNNQHKIQKGDTFLIDGVTITVLNNFDLSITHNGVNNTSFVYDVNIAGKRMLVLGDLGAQSGERLLAEYGDRLKADIVQMSHHGQRGVKKDVYTAIHPRICLWPTPLFLWENDCGSGPSSGTWETNQVKTWMEELGVRIHHVIGLQKDDIVIE